VIVSNQAMMWRLLRQSGIADHLKGYGQLFQH
jgi:maleate isomerase